MRNPNLSTNYKNGYVVGYTSEPTENLKCLRCQFDTLEEAEFYIATCKLLQQQGKPLTEAPKLITYMFRMMGIKSNWSE